MVTVINSDCRTKKIYCISSKTEDDKHILIWDFDNIDIYDLLKSLSKSQSVNGLSNIYIFKSKNGFNAICLDKFLLNEAYNIKINTKWSDYWHTKIGYKSDSWCWQVDNKEYIKHLPPTSKYENRIQSNAHKILLEKEFNLKINCGDFDKFTKINVESYNKDVI